ncbi:hypothetical protein ACFW1L_01305, partial [Streptomyces olivaceus]|uniref:hypothetical protein n=1 Tax=Streptomyces olivaceus TaxID=47716 RepID=UPI003684E518
APVSLSLSVPQRHSVDSDQGCSTSLLDIAARCPTRSRPADRDPRETATGTPTAEAPTAEAS